MAPEDADVALFGETVTVDCPLRIAVLRVPTEESLEEIERVLLSLGAMDERAVDEVESAHGGDAAIRRLEAKIDLSLRLLVTALPALRGPPLIRGAALSVRGVRLPMAAVTVPDGVDLADPGWYLRWQPLEALPISVSLPVSMLARSTDRVWWAIGPLGTGLAEALERQVFRQHRRQRAEQRRG